MTVGALQREESVSAYLLAEVAIQRAALHIRLAMADLLVRPRVREHYRAVISVDVGKRVENVRQALHRHVARLVILRVDRPVGEAVSSDALAHHDAAVGSAITATRAVVLLKDLAEAEWHGVCYL